MKTFLNKLALNPTTVIVLLVAVVLAFSLGFMVSGGGEEHAHELTMSQNEETKPTRWTCAKIGRASCRERV